MKKNNNQDEKKSFYNINLLIENKQFCMKIKSYFYKVLEKNLLLDDKYTFVINYLNKCLLPIKAKIQIYSIIYLKDLATVSV